MTATDPRHQLQAAADAQWEQYLSTVRTGSTPEQRQQAYDQWRARDDKLTEHDGHVERRQAHDRAQANTETLPVAGGA